MNKFLFCFCMVVISLSPLYAQVTVGAAKYEGVRKLKPEEYNLIGKKTTIFVTDAYSTSDIEPIFKEVWRINPYKIITREEYDKNFDEFIKGENAIFVLGGSFKEGASLGGSGIGYSYSLYYIQYFYPSDIKMNKGKIQYDVNQIAQMYFYPGGGAKGFGVAWRDHDYTKMDTQLTNFKLGYLKNYLMVIQNTLAQKQIVSTYDNISRHPELSNLKKGTLFFSESLYRPYEWAYVNTKKNPDATAKDQTDEALTNYKFSYQFIDDSELQKRIMNNEDFYYYHVVRLDPVMITSVINAKTGEVIFRQKRLDKSSIHASLKDLTSEINKS